MSTNSSNVFIPQVIGDTATDILFKRTPLLASGYVADGTPLAVYPGTGKSVTFIAWQDPDDLDYNSVVQTTVDNSRNGVSAYGFSQDSYVENLIEKTISFDADRALLVDMAPNHDLVNQYSLVVASKMQSAIQRDLLDKAETTNLSLDVTGESTKTLTVDAILRARMEWGEYSNIAKPALFVHSKQYKDLAQTEEFRELATAFNKNLGAADPNGPGAIASVHGVDIWLCDSVTISDSNYTSIMLMPGALVLYLKDVITPEPISHAGSRTITLDTHFRWTSTLLRNKPRGVVKLITQ